MEHSCKLFTFGNDVGKRGIVEQTYLLGDIGLRSQFSARALRDAKESLSRYVTRAQKERILITRHGRPAALMIGVQGHDVEDLILAADPEFWRMIEARRREPSLSLEELKTEH